VGESRTGRLTFLLLELPDPRVHGEQIVDLDRRHLIMEWWRDVQFGGQDVGA
jgi:hypothetical protein